MAFFLTAGMALLFLPIGLAAFAAQAPHVQGSILDTLFPVFVVELLGNLGMIVGCVSSQTL